MDLAAVIGDTAKILAGLSAIGGVFYTFFKWVRPGFEEIKNSFASIKTIQAELRPNGGSSLRDAVDRIHKDTIRMDARQWAIVASLNDPLWESDPQGNCIRANNSLLALAERTMDEFEGNGWENIVAPEDKERVWAEWRAAVERKRVFESMFTIRSRSGKFFKVTVVCNPYVNSTSDEVLGFIGRYTEVVPVEK